MEAPRGGHAVVGSKVHDAKLVALMNVHGIGRILTFETSDFSRYETEAAGSRLSVFLDRPEWVTLRRRGPGGLGSKA